MDKTIEAGNQVHTYDMGEEEVPVVDFDRCFGCAVCATGCPEDAITMVNKPDFPEPPKNGKELKAAIVASKG